jgi:predicted AlkP superfamily phosphohydrolase/phosphomutase
MERTIVVGLDGGNWPLIREWMDEGRLPNIQHLYETGASGVSRSHLPPVTCPNWKCYASGKNPGKLGVYWWERIDTDERTMSLPDSTSFSSPEIWDYVNHAGGDAGVINLPMSYPPRQIDGVMVAGGPRSRERAYTKPEGLQQELEDRFDYRVHPENVLTSNSNAEQEVEMVYDLLRTRLRTAWTLFEERDLTFLHVTLFHLNVLQHYFWDGAETRRAWELVDEELEPFVEADCNLVLMSDHGCTGIHTVFYINRWLEEQGYLQTRSSLASRLFDIGLTQEQVASMVRSLGLESYIRPLVPRAIIERFPSDEGVVREEKLEMVDWEGTQAIGSGQGLVYIVADDADERNRIFDSLKQDLEAETGLNGEPIVSAVYRPEEIYRGEYVGLAPDLIFDQTPGVHTGEAMGNGPVKAAPSNWRGENVPDGMVLFHGPDVRPTSIDPIRISDIAPTVLHWMGLDVPQDMDGSVVADVFTVDSRPATQSVNYRSPLVTSDAAAHADDELSDEAQRRLEDIGYLE